MWSYPGPPSNSSLLSWTLYSPNTHEKYLTSSACAISCSMASIPDHLSLFLLSPLPSLHALFSLSNHPPSPPSNSHGVTGPGLPSGPKRGLAGDCERARGSCAARAAASTISRWYWRRRARVFASVAREGVDEVVTDEEEEEVEVVEVAAVLVDGAEVDVVEVVDAVVVDVLEVGREGLR